MITATTGAAVVAGGERLMMAVIVVHHHEVVRDALCQRLRAEPDVDVVASVANDERAIEAFALHPSALVLMGQRLPSTTSVDLIEGLRQVDPGVLAVMLVESDDLQVAVMAIRSGVSGIVRSHTAAAGLVHTLRVVADGACVIDRDALSMLAEAWDHSPAAPLSSREREVLGCLAIGLTNAEIATRLFVSRETVKTHVAHLLRKLDAQDRRAAVDKGALLGHLGPLQPA